MPARLPAGAGELPKPRQGAVIDVIETLLEQLGR
jgi:hypothetical protein